ncbi:hypothetical protein GCM10027422_19970 [Hymenobacter arcticus]
MNKKGYLWLGVISLLALVFLFEYLKTVYKIGIANTSINVVFNILLAILTGLIVGIYFDLSSRSEIADNMLKHFEMSKEVLGAGIMKYYQNFSDFDLRKAVSNSNDIIIYLTYGQTTFSNIRDSLDIVAKRKSTIKIFMYHEDNEFINGLGKHWGANDPNYNVMRIKQRVLESQQTLTSYFGELKKKKLLKAKVQIFLMKKHPVFYSFYKLDDHILFCPSKISTDKSVKPMALYVRDNGNNGCIFRKCMDEIKGVIEESSFYELKNF